MNQPLRIGQVADLAGVNIQTLRYYERRGLLDPPQRRPSGQREYPEQTVALVRVVKAAQRLGFTLAEIQDLLQVSAHRAGPSELRRRATAKIDEIDRKIAQLQAVRATLVAVLDADCDSLTDCSCGLGWPSPEPRPSTHTPAGSPTARRARTASRPAMAAGTILRR